jgi:hypothetical protein
VRLFVGDELKDLVSCLGLYFEDKMKFVLKLLID